MNKNQDKILGLHEKHLDITEEAISVASSHAKVTQDLAQNQLKIAGILREITDSIKWLHFFLFFTLILVISDDIKNIFSWLSNKWFSLSENWQTTLFGAFWTLFIATLFYLLGKKSRT